jgi:hypothetical protein
MRRATGLATLLTVIAAAPAGAAIVPQRGMAKLRLGMSVTEVRAARGVPDHDVTSPNALFGTTRTYTYGTVKVLFNGSGSTATAIVVETNEVGERTSTGIGVGSTRQAVKASVPGIQCHVEKSGVNHCYVGRYKVHHRITEFRIGRSGLVSRVRIGIVFSKKRRSAYG